MRHPAALRRAPPARRDRSIARWTALLAWAASATAVSADCPGRTQAEMNRCAHDAYLAADAELNDVWPAAKASMDRVGTGDLLLDAQRKWIAFRDAACAAEASPYAGGSIQPQILATCLTRLTQRRIEDLRILLF